MDEGDGNGDRRQGEGKEEEGERRRASSFPGVFIDNGGGWRATTTGRHVTTCRPILTRLPPQQLGGIVDDRGGVLPTRCPPFNFIYPPLLGGFFLASLTTTGAACNPHTTPFNFFFLLPPVGGSFFSMGNEAACNPHAASISFRPPPSFGGGVAYSPPIDQGDPFKKRRGSA